MDAKYKLTIPKPCHEDWNKMTPDATGRFCGSCIKSVVDFTTMNASEIQDYFTKNQGKSVCGRFKNEQLESVIIKIPSQVLYSQTNFHKMFLLALFISMGTTLLSCADKNGDRQKIDSVEVVDGNNDNATTGAPIFRNDSVIKIHPSESKTEKGKSVKEQALKGKTKCQQAKSEGNPKISMTSGLVMPEIIRDTIPTEKK